MYNNKSIILTEAEKERAGIIKGCLEGDHTNSEAAERLGLSVRQVRRLKRKVEELGVEGIAHGLTGSSSHRKLDAKREKKVLVFLKKKDHHDFGPTFAMEKLEEQENIILDVGTIRRIMIDADLWQPKQRRSKQSHRQWREPMPRYGELIQYDGSYHDWNEDKEEECLLKAIDDATSIVTKAVFDDHEGIVPTFRFWWDYVERHGRPRAIYLDKFSTYKVNHQSAQDNIHLLTQFERAMKALDIKIITAHSPEAKGRVERGFRTHQDRLVKELRLAKKKTLGDMNLFLQAVYIPKHNSLFSRKPSDPEDAHRPLTDEQKKKLPSIFSKQFSRIVKNDFTIQWNGRWFQLLNGQPTTVYKGDEVIIEERLDDSIHIRHTRNEEAYLLYQEVPNRPKQVRRPPTVLERKSTAHKPASNHPWKRKY
jgi:transposase